MIKLFISVLGFLFIFCKEDDYSIAAGTIAERNKSAINVKAFCYEDSNWIQHFREFRMAVYQDNKDKVKSFFVFPVMSENNEIWDLVTDGNTEPLKLHPGKIKPFTEKDFDQYFGKLFSRRFINALLKVKTDELYKKGETATIQLSEEKATTYQMIASFDKDDKTLNLNLASNTIMKDKDGEVLDGGEFSINYIFSILANGQIRFSQVRMAG
ncbi:MAG: hypothetical protein ABUT20_57950 [Bacteroidota bacterium]